MSESKRIEDRLRRSFEGGAWHGPALGEILDGVSASEAAARPIAGAHTILEVVLHLATWQDVVRRRALGEETGEILDEVDWPRPEAGEGAWRAATARLEESHAKLRATVRALDDERLGELAVPTRETVREQLLGVLQHDAYHAGQIVLLARAARAAG